MTWPLVTQFTTAVPGDGVDSWGNIWNMWWLKHAFLSGHNPFATSMLYYPNGTSLLLHTLNPFNFLISLPVQAFFGLIVAYNTVIIFSLSASGYATYLLAYHTTRQQRAALLGGLIFMSSGYLMSQAMGHLNLVAAEWLPLSALALRRVLERATPGRIIVAALCLACNVLCDWQYLVFALLWAGWQIGAVVIQTRQLRSARALVVAVVGAVGLVAALGIATARQAAQTPNADTGEEHRLQHGADLLDLLIPNQLHPIWGGAAAQAQAYKEDTLLQNKVAYLGVPVLALALIALRQSAARFWLVGAGIFYLLALGVSLHVAGQNTQVPMPAALLYQIPFLKIFRFPMRYVVVTLMALSVAAAMGAALLLDALKNQRPLLRHVIAPALGLLILVDQLTLPYPMVGIYVPPFYEQIGAEPEDFAVLESPLYARTSLIYMFYQAIHQKPLVGGYLARQMPYPFVDEFPIVRMFASAHAEPDIIRQNPQSVAQSLFSYFNIRYLVLHSEGGALRYHMLMRIAEAAADGTPPLREELPGRSFLVYQVKPPEVALPFIGIGNGWSAPQIEANQPVRQIIGPAELHLYNADTGDLTLSVDLRSPAPDTLEVAVRGASTTYTLARGAKTITVSIPPGTTPASIVITPNATTPVTVTGIDIVISHKP